MEFSKKSEIALSWIDYNQSFNMQEVCSKVVSKAKLNDIDTKLSIYDNCVQKFQTVNKNLLNLDVLMK